MKARIVGIATCSVLIVLALQDARANETEGLQPQRIRVLCRTDPSSTATISWDTAEQGSRHFVRLAAKGDDQPKIVVARHNGRYTGGSGYFHHARVTGLSADTEYVMTLHSDKSSSDVYRIRTTSNLDRPVSLLYTQCPIDGEHLETSLEATGRAIAAEGRKSAALVMQCDAIAGFASWRAWLDMYAEASDRSKPLLPIAPVPGKMNEVQYAEWFDLRDRETTYYRLPFGKQLGLLVLDTSISLAGRQREWLADEIKSERRKRRWMMATYAAAAYPATTRPSRVHAHWTQLFDDFHVDLACESERFGYRRSMAIRGGARDDLGTVYLGLGETPYRIWRPRQPRWYLAPPGTVDRSTGSVLLEFKDDSLTIVATATDGRRIESHRVEPRK